METIIINTPSKIYFNTPVRALKFNQDTAYKYEQLCNCQAGLIYQKLNKGEKLTDSESKYLFDEISNAGFYSEKGHINTMGWSIDFTKFLKLYLVKHHGAWHEYLALDKTMIRNSDKFRGKIERIIEIPKE